MRQPNRLWFVIIIWDSLGKITLSNPTTTIFASVIVAGILGSPQSIARWCLLNRSECRVSGAVLRNTNAAPERRAHIFVDGT